MEHVSVHAGNKETQDDALTMVWVAPGSVPPVALVTLGKSGEVAHSPAAWPAWVTGTPSRVWLTCA